MDIVSVHYKDIISLFKSRQHIVEFDPDLFGDAFIKCSEHFGNTEIDYNTAIKYYWVVYVNTVKSNFINKSKYTTISLDNLDIIDDSSIDNFYNEVLNSISQEFGENNMQMYRLYKCYNWSEDELNSIGIILDKHKIKEITKFIKSKYRKEHQ